MPRGSTWSVNAVSLMTAVLSEIIISHVYGYLQCRIFCVYFYKIIPRRYTLICCQNLI